MATVLLISTPSCGFFVETGFFLSDFSESTRVRETTLSANDRRFTPRHKLQIPLIIQPLVGSSASPQTTESTDVSIRGFYFSSNESFEIGTPVKVLLRMPEQITGRPSPKWSCMGRVVRVDPGGDNEGRRGIGVEIHYYDVLSA
ncbi:MAG TPA: PilZ domain-containing protein [Terriglobales bacterium]|nr:PilZ domain-containing protein [Terriglobales bacterium]